MSPFPTFQKSASYDRIELDDRDIEHGLSYAEPFEIGEVDDDEHDDHDVDTNDVEDPDNLPSSASDSNMAMNHHPLYSRRAPTNYYCPVTLHLMEDPVWDGCGHCYDRDAISSWLDFHPLCPISRKPLNAADLIPATALQERISHWRQQQSTRVLSTPDLLSLEETDSHSQLKFMLLPQERRVLSIIKFRKQVRTQKEAYSRCLWIVGAIITFSFVVTTFAAIYVFHVEFRAPL